MNNLQVTDEAINIFKELNVAENKTVCSFLIFSREHILEIYTIYFKNANFYFYFYYYLSNNSKMKH